MGRKLRTNVPEREGNFTPQLLNFQKFRTDDEQYKKKQKHYYNRHHTAHDLPEFGNDTPVFIHNGGSSSIVSGRIVASTGPRSYTVETPTGWSRRNQSHLNHRPVVNDAPQPNAPRSPIMTRTI